MTTRNHIVPLAAVFALTSLSVMVAAPQQPHRAGALDGPARVHGAAVNGASAQNAPSRSSDRQGVYQRLTGTYQLERSRGDDPGQAVEQATRALPANQRQGAYQRLMNRLNAPETIAIDRTGLSVTIASSRGQQVTFEADGQIRAEQGSAGRPVNTRATLYGDQLVVTTTAGSGNGGNDFAVTFEPLDGGRSLRVTKRIYDDNLRQPVAVQSFYRKSSDEAEWGVFSDPRRASSGMDLPRGTELTITSGTF
jgi:hypothetical protein